MHGLMDSLEVEFVEFIPLGEYCDCMRIIRCFVAVTRDDHIVFNKPIHRAMRVNNSSKVPPKGG